MKKYFLLTPGPTPVPPEVSLEEALPVLHHRTTEFGAVFTRVLEDLKYAFQTKNQVLLMSASGTGAMESAVVNTLSPGSKAIVATSGSFGNRWGKICQAYGVEPVMVQEEWGKPVRVDQIQDALKKNPDAVAVFATHTETSTGTVNDVKAIGEAVSKTNAVFVLDAISGLGGQEMRTDEWNVDVCVTGSQKGLMTPPGLAFVSVSQKAWKVVEAAKLPRFYWDYRKMLKSVADKETPFTPPVSLIVALAKALSMVKAEGIENIWKRHLMLSHAAQSGFKALGLSLFSTAPCSVLTAANVPAGVEGGKLVKKMREEYGVSIAGGQEHLKGKIVRLAHMGYMEKFDLIIGVSALEMALKEMGYAVEVGKGVAALETSFVANAKSAPVAAAAAH